MSVDLELYLQISLTLFIIIDPIGYSLLFFSLTKDYEKEIKNKIAILSVFYSLCAFTFQNTSFKIL
jgi:small neutral amino acid transporter SnatA (MarC family)